MPKIPHIIETWQMVRPWGKDKETGAVVEGKFERVSLSLPELRAGEVLVEIAGCGLCHTDLGYFFDGVPTVNKPPLTLGHEISGTVVTAGEGAGGWVEREVIIPAVMPCRECYLCKTGRGNRCLNQKMPGNSLGVYGGFSSHIPVPAIDLCMVRQAHHARPSALSLSKGDFPLSHLAVIADAVTTPFQACKRADLQAGDRVIVLGCAGGVGTYVTQMAKALGARVVIGIDIVPEKLERALEFGADFVINSRDKGPRDVRQEFRTICQENGIEAGYGWKIFEVTGTRGGQEIALELLSFVGKLILIGFGTQKNEYSLSRLMAFDAEIIGTWGCLPEYYPVVLDMVLKGKIQIEPFVEVRPMSQIAQVFDEVHRAGSPPRRIVLTPDFPET